jgi:hypothetical protein
MVKNCRRNRLRPDGPAVSMSWESTWITPAARRSWMPAKRVSSDNPCRSAKLLGENHIGGADGTRVRRPKSDSAAAGRRWSVR